jgi:hypothetical protein
VRLRVTGCARFCLRDDDRTNKRISLTHVRWANPHTRLRLATCERERRREPHPRATYTPLTGAWWLCSCVLMTMVETHWMLWVGAVGFGVGVSGCFAAAVSQLQAYMGMTGRAGAWVAAGATSGTLVQLVTSQVRVCVCVCVTPPGPALSSVRPPYPPHPPTMSERDRDFVQCDDGCWPRVLIV